MTAVDSIGDVLREARTIAVVGCSRHEHKDAHRIPAFLKEMGYGVLPVNPHADTILGERAYPDLLTAAEHVTHSIDVVDVFRPPEDVPPIAEQAVEIGARVLWLQKGIRNDRAARKTRAAGLTVVQDQCIYVEYRNRFGTRPLAEWRS